MGGCATCQSYAPGVGFAPLRSTACTQRDTEREGRRTIEVLHPIIHLCLFCNAKPFRPLLTFLGNGHVLNHRCRLISVRLVSDTSFACSVSPVQDATTDECMIVWGTSVSKDQGRHSTLQAHMVDGSEGAQDEGTYSEKVLVTLWATDDSFYPSLSLSLSLLRTTYGLSLPLSRPLPCHDLR
jgi:hypothetical protein